VGAVVTGGAAAENRRRKGMNTLYFGDNLEVLRESIADRSVDLVYLDSPFNSGANYNIIFQPEKKSVALRRSFR
jgi:adenine specific DNA methylase Mod